MNFTVYSKPGCPYCDRIKLVMERANLRHKVYVLDEHFTRDEFYDEFGVGSTFPQVVNGAEHLGGCTETVQYLRKNNIV